MPRLIRMDASGHSTLAQWTAEDQAAFELAAGEFRQQLEAGYIGVLDQGRERPRRSASFRAMRTS